MSDWYEHMIDYESKHGEKYGIDVRGGLIEIWRLGSYRTVARFTAEQASVFFEGLVNHGGTEKGAAMLEWNVSYLRKHLDRAGIRYSPSIDNMTVLERYCYLTQYAERHKLIEPQAN